MRETWGSPAVFQVYRFVCLSHWGLMVETWPCVLGKMGRTSYCRLSASNYRLLPLTAWKLRRLRSPCGQIWCLVRAFPWATHGCHFIVPSYGRSREKEERSGFFLSLLIGVLIRLLRALLRGLIATEDPTPSTITWRFRVSQCLCTQGQSVYRTDAYCSP